ncbi:MAG: dipeptidase [Promethearchaeota archaeon]
MESDLDDFRFPVVDGHIDTMLAHIAQGRRISIESGRGHCDIPRMRRGGVIAAVFALCPASSSFLMRSFAWIWMRVVNSETNALFHVRKYDDFARAGKSGMIGAIFCFEGAGGIDPELRSLESWARKGLRQINITWANVNRFGTGAKFKGKQLETGLTELGRKFVIRAQDLGITIDVSHLNDRSFWDVMEIAKKPVVASHSNARAVLDHPRNLTDEQIKAIAEKHGTVGINFVLKFLAMEKADGKIEVSMNDIKRHIDRVVEVGGIDSIAIGSDFDGASVPRCIKDCSMYPELFRFLLENGYSKDDVEKMASENLKRVYKQTWN